MVNRGQLKLLKQGSKSWNQWRLKHSDVEANLRNANLSRANLSNVNLKNANLKNANLKIADLSGADLSGADLSGADLKNANIRNADLIGANLSGVNPPGIDFNVHFITFSHASAALAEKLVGRIGTNLSGANLSGANLSGAFFIKANFSRANLSGANLNDANLSGANLRNANLSRALLFASQLLESDLTSTNLTGACVQDWNINSLTQLHGVICEYIYLKSEWSEQEQKYRLSERRPSDPKRIFVPGEFQAFIQKVLSTVDLIFADGIDWQAFFQSFQELQSQYDDLSIQAIEKKSGGAFVIRLEVPPEADKAAIESHAKELYEMRLQLQEQRYQAELQAKDGQISLYQEQLEFHRKNNTNLMEIVKTMAEKENQPTHQTIINAQTIGATHSGSGDITNFTQNINSNINDITTLINALRDTAQTFPDEQRQEALEHLGDVEEGIRQPDQVKPHRVKAALAALLTIAGMVAATTDFSNNVLEIGNKLGIELIQPHSK